MSRWSSVIAVAKDPATLRRPTFVEVLSLIAQANSEDPARVPFWGAWYDGWECTPMAIFDRAKLRMSTTYTFAIFEPGDLACLVNVRKWLRRHPVNAYAIKSMSATAKAARDWAQVTNNQVIVATWCHGGTASDEDLGVVRKGGSGAWHQP